MTPQEKHCEFRYYSKIESGNPSVNGAIMTFSHYQRFLSREMSVHLIIFSHISVIRPPRAHRPAGPAHAPPVRALRLATRGGDPAARRYQRGGLTGREIVDLKAALGVRLRASSVGERTLRPIAGRLSAEQRCSTSASNRPSGYERRVS